MRWKVIVLNACVDRSTMIVPMSRPELTSSPAMSTSTPVSPSIRDSSIRVAPDGAELSEFRSALAVIAARTTTTGATSGDCQSHKREGSEHRGDVRFEADLQRIEDVGEEDGTENVLEKRPFAG